ncbi:MAG: hypothetical protein ABFC24_00365, partial [Methanoregulaceae archaeon]
LPALFTKFCHRILYRGTAVLTVFYHLAVTDSNCIKIHNKSFEMYLLGIIPEIPVEKRLDDPESKINPIMRHILKRTTKSHEKQVGPS